MARRPALAARLDGIVFVLFCFFSFNERLKQALIGMTAGATGALVGAPAEIALVRMMSDSRLPENQRRGYKNVADALVKIVQQEGVLTLWRGVTPTVTRAIVLNAAQVFLLVFLVFFFCLFLMLVGKKNKK